MLRRVARSAVRACRPVSAKYTLVRKSAGHITGPPARATATITPPTAQPRYVTYALYSGAPKPRAPKETVLTMPMA